MPNWPNRTPCSYFGWFYFGGGACTETLPVHNAIQRLRWNVSFSRKRFCFTEVFYSLKIFSSGSFFRTEEFASQTDVSCGRAFHMDLGEVCCSGKRSVIRVGEAWCLGMLCRVRGRDLALERRRSDIADRRSGVRQRAGIWVGLEFRVKPDVGGSAYDPAHCAQTPHLPVQVKIGSRSTIYFILYVLNRFDSIWFVSMQK